MTDRELLEAAAKAAGFVVRRYIDSYDDYYWYGPDSGLEVEGIPGVWTPLTDDGDALRLAVKLNLQVTPGTYRADEATAYRAGHAEANERIHYQQDLLSATRRAIGRAAAEIGRAMK